MKEGTTEALKCFATLYEAVCDAGGTVSPDLLDMSVGDFISKIAGPNHIVFGFQKPAAPIADIHD